MTKFFEFVDELIKRIIPFWQLLRGKTHNRLATGVVWVGLAAFVSPIWMPIVQAVLERLGLHFEQTISQAFGFGLVCVGLLYHFFADRVATYDSRQTAMNVREHDKTIINSIQERFPGANIRFLLDRIATDHAIFDDELTTLETMERLLGEPEFHVLDKEVSTKFLALKISIHALLRFIGAQFFRIHHGTSNNRVCLQPDWNIDRSAPHVPTPAEERQYDELAETLSKLVTAVGLAHREMIETAHRQVL